MRGWGRGLRTAIQNWYGNKSNDTIAFQALKYQSRDGWSQKDLITMAHLNPGNDQIRSNLYRYIVKGAEGLKRGDQVPAIIVAYEQAKTMDRDTLAKHIVDHRLSHEMIPNEMKNHPIIWEALFQNMKSAALARNLNKMTSIGLISQFSNFTKQVTAKLTDEASLKADMIHPLTLLIARKQYAQGRGLRGSLSWTPNAHVTAALEAAFYSSFKTVEPTGKNVMICLDVSRSMNANVVGIENLTNREAAAVMAMVTLRAEKWSAIFGFDHKFRDLGILPTDNLETVCQKTYSPNFGATDPSVAILEAEKNKWDVDAFCIYTDNEVNKGVHASGAIKAYRAKVNKPDAKMIVAATQMNNFSIADPKDRNMLDIAGFDSAAPQLISSFIQGLV
jgi:60 kDa SS-A/Ro ribonucleoprotein